MNILKLYFKPCRKSSYERLSKNHRLIFYNCMPVDLFDCFKYDIAGTVVKAIRDIFKSLSGNIIKEINPMERLTKCISAKEINSAMVLILEEIYNYSKGKTIYVWTDTYSLFL